MTARPPIAAPVHGGQILQIAARIGVRADQLLDFSANINPKGPSVSVLAAIQRVLADPATLAAYPDLELTELKHTIASSTGVHSSGISVANGFVPLLEAALRSLKIKRCLLPVPSFSEYRRTLENAAIEIVPFQLSTIRNFQYDPSALAEKFLDRACDAILLANPQNPSGVSYTALQMKQLIEFAAQSSVAVLLDEAFIDYCPDHSLIQTPMESPGSLVVFRSVTKFFAIPGLRVAYAISNRSNAQTLNRYLAPWPVSSLASAAVCAALRDDAYAVESRLDNKRRLAWLTQELARLNLATYPSSANFLLFRCPPGVEVGELWERMIVTQHIVLRSCANFEALACGHLRVAIRLQRENERLVSALNQVLDELSR